MVTYNLWVCVREGERENTSVMPVNNMERNTKGRGEGKGREGSLREEDQGDQRQRRRGGKSVEKGEED